MIDLSVTELTVLIGLVRRDRKQQERRSYKHPVAGTKAKKLGLLLAKLNLELVRKHSQ